MTRHAKPLLRGSVLLAGLALLAACTSSPEVRDLAKKTSANVGTLAITIDEMSKQSGNLADRRAASISRLAVINKRVAADLELRLAVLKVSGDKVPLDTQKELKAWIDKVLAIEARADLEEAEFARQVLSDRLAIESRSDQLKTVAKALATLAEEENLADRAAFLAKFGKEVASQVRDKKKEMDAATKAAEEKLAATAAANDNAGVVGAGEGVN